MSRHLDPKADEISGNENDEDRNKLYTWMVSTNDLLIVIHDNPELETEFPHLRFRSQRLPL